MFSKHIKLPLLVLLTAATPFLFTSCNDDDDDETEQENITTVVVHLTGPGFDREFEWNDPDGPGGNAPTIQEIVIPPLTGNIDCHIHVYDRSKTPEVDITEEIEEEALEHLLTYAISGADVDIVYNDADSAGKPLGIKTRWTTDQPSTGNVRIVMYHEPTNKDNLADPGGETDFDVTFPVRIQ